MDNYSFLGKGIYSIPDVSRYTGIDPRKIKRWTNGYKSKNEKTHPPVYNSDFQSMGNKTSLSFLDLIEIRFIDAFHKYGVSWKAIRIASEKAKEIIGKDHPFATRKFYTDKKSILTRIAIAEKENELLNLVNSQYEIDEILSPCLIEGLDFNDLDVAFRWHPAGRNKPILIDPSHNFGKPVVDKIFMDTKLIFDLYKTNKTIEEISYWYDVDRELIQYAVEYEEKLVA